MKTIPSLIIAAVFASLTFAVWAYLNRPKELPWPAASRVRVLAVPRQRGSHSELPTDEEIGA
jgi:hypothetical protein